MSETAWSHLNELVDGSYSADSIYSFEVSITQSMIHHLSVDRAECCANSWSLLQHVDLATNECIQKTLDTVDQIILLNKPPDPCLPEYLLAECSLWSNQFSKKFTQYVLYKLTGFAD